MIAPCKAWSAFLTFVLLFVCIASRPSNAQTCAVEWEPTAPPGVREEHAMAYDSARGVTVLFGGYDYDPDLGKIYSAETWEWDGVTWTQKSTTGPTPRAGHAMAYDSRRGVTVLFGGSDGSGETGDTWEWDGTNWTSRNTTGPVARSDHALAFDSARGVSVLFGGRYEASGYQFFGDTWEWDGTNWTLRSDSGPGPRGAHAMAFDSTRNVTVLFGGGSGPYYNGPTFGDTWEWDGVIWTPRSNGGPSPRIGHAMAYDTLRGVSVLFGGALYDYSGETWEWDGAAWRIRADSGPMAQSWHAMAYDNTRGVTVLQGLWTTDWTNSLPATWEWDGVQWAQQAQPCVQWSPHPPGVPQPMYGAGLVFDSARKVAVLFGQGDLYNPNDTWEWDGATWAERVVSPPPPRWDHSMAYDIARGVTVLFGGVYDDVGSSRNDTWEWDGTDWRWQSDSGPVPRHGAGMVYDSLRGVTVLFGGSIGWESDFGDTWEWDGVSWTWRSDTGPSPRSGHAMAFDSARGVTVLFGGCQSGGTMACFRETWEWDGNVWTKRVVTGDVPQSGALMAYDSSRGVMVLSRGSETWEWDGSRWTLASATGPVGSGYAVAISFDSFRGVTIIYGSIVSLADIWEWDGSQWTVHSFDPPARAGQAMAYDQARQTTVMFGGGDNPYRSDTWEWDGSTWTFRTAAGPARRADHEMAYDRARGVTVLFGGRSWTYPGPSITYGDTWEWDGTIWTLRSTSGPSPRSDHAMAYDEARGVVILFGGYFYVSLADTFIKFGDTWEWDGVTWTLRSATGPPPRSGHAMAYDSA
ncbi:MAG: kelch repeat-containing protein, partial [Phycisphaerales bacterium]|nr:kelch repeat-containing protein [Phycisphaerales bacterium]